MSEFLYTSLISGITEESEFCPDTTSQLIIFVDVEVYFIRVRRIRYGMSNTRIHACHILVKLREFGSKHITVHIMIKDV